MTSKLVRESEGYKFYSIAHETEESANNTSNSNNSPAYDSITKAWYNISHAGRLSYQEDFRVEQK